MTVLKRLDELFSENRFESIIRKYYNCFIDFKFEFIEHEDPIFILYTSLVNAGYYLTAIEGIGKTLSKFTNLSHFKKRRFFHI